MRSAVVRINRRCSGVCVSASGLVLSVKHCGTPANAIVQFSGREVPAKLVHVCGDSPDGDGPIAFQCDAGLYPFAPIAAAVPQTGDAVHSWGFPRGVLTHGAGVLLGNNKVHNVVSFRAGPGWSGGPLFNAAGEVVGLCSHSERERSCWFSWDSVRQAVAAAVGAAVGAGNDAPGSRLTSADDQRRIKPRPDFEPHTHG